MTTENAENSGAAMSKLKSGSIASSSSGQSAIDQAGFNEKMTKLRNELELLQVLFVFFYLLDRLRVEDPKKKSAIRCNSITLQFPVPSCPTRTKLVWNGKGTVTQLRGRRRE